VVFLYKNRFKKLVLFEKNNIWLQNYKKIKYCRIFANIYVHLTSFLLSISIDIGYSGSKAISTCKAMFRFLFECHPDT